MFKVQGFSFKVRYEIISVPLEINFLELIKYVFHVLSLVPLPHFLSSKLLINLIKDFP